MSVEQRKRFHAKEQTLRDFHGAFSVPEPMRNVKEAKVFLDSIIKEVGAKEGVEHEILIESWNRIAGDFISKHAEPFSLKRGVLVLRVLQPAIRFHLEQAKGQLLKNLQKELGKAIVKQVQFRIG